MNSRRKILFVGLALGGGGAERVAALLLAHLDRSRFEPYSAIFVKEYEGLFDESV